MKPEHEEATNITEIVSNITKMGSNIIETIQTLQMETKEMHSRTRRVIIHVGYLSIGVLMGAVVSLILTIR